MKYGIFVFKNLIIYLQWIKIIQSTSYHYIINFQILQLQMNDYKYHYLFTTFVSNNKSIKWHIFLLYILLLRFMSTFTCIQCEAKAYLFQGIVKGLCHTERHRFEFSTFFLLVINYVPLILHYSISISFLKSRIYPPPPAYRLFLLS